MINAGSSSAQQYAMKEEKEVPRNRGGTKSGNNNPIWGYYKDTKSITRIDPEYKWVRYTEWSQTRDI